MKKVAELMQAHFEKMCATGNLYLVELSNTAEIYLKGFDNDPVFRDPESSTHKCNICLNFLRRYGHIVAIDENYKLITLFGFDPQDTEYTQSFKDLDKAISESKIISEFRESYEELNALPYEKTTPNMPMYKLGIPSNHKIYTEEEAAKFGVVTAGEVYTFNHMMVFLPKEFVIRGISKESYKGSINTKVQVFKRGLETIPLDTLQLVKDLILQNSLLNGTSYLPVLESFINAKTEYESIGSKDKENWIWKFTTRDEFIRIADFRNQLIGVLCVELAEGLELNKACLNWNKRADPANYMKAVAPITKAQIELAKKFVEENGYEDSFKRRYATLQDIKTSEIHHINADTDNPKDVSIFDGVKAGTPSRHKRNEFDGVEEVTIEKFMKDILPSCTAVSVLLENRLKGNMVTMTTSANDESKPIFKWGNNYSWTYKGNLAGKSMITQAVKELGGQIDAVIRCSLAWNQSGTDTSDLDLWCDAPGERIGYNTGYRKDSTGRFSPAGGQLDLDNTNPGTALGVENIYYKDASKLKTGRYVFYVNPFSPRNSQGFKAELLVNDELFSYSYDQRVNNNVKIATVSVHADGSISIEHHLTPTEGTSQKIYGLDSNEFHKVKLVCLSPNYWAENAVGNKHYFFMLDGAKVDEPIRGFHNENLKGEFSDHRKVMDVLGNTTVIEANGSDQLSGVGFNATVKDHVILKLEGNFKRVIKVTF